MTGCSLSAFLSQMLVNMNFLMSLLWARLAVYLLLILTSIIMNDGDAYFVN